MSDAGSILHAVEELTGSGAFPQNMWPSCPGRKEGTSSIQHKTSVVMDCPLWARAMTTEKLNIRFPGALQNVSPHLSAMAGGTSYAESAGVGGIWSFQAEGGRCRASMDQLGMEGDAARLGGSVEVGRKWAADSSADSGVCARMSTCRPARGGSRSATSTSLMSDGSGRRRRTPPPSGP